MISGNRYKDEFKRDAVAQVVDREYAVSEVADRLGVSTNSLYIWKGRFSKPAKEAKVDTGQSREIRRLKAELERVTEERDILKKAIVYFARKQNEVRVCRRAPPYIFDPCDVPMPANPPQRVLRMAEEPSLQKSSQGHTPDRIDQRGMGGQR